MEFHEKYCLRKPENHADCLTGCENLVSYHNSASGRLIKFYCSHFRTDVHSKALEGKVHRTGKDGNLAYSKLMPIKCESKVQGYETVKEYKEEEYV